MRIRPFIAIHTFWLVSLGMLCGCGGKREWKLVHADELHRLVEGEDAFHVVQWAYYGSDDRFHYFCRRISPSEVLTIKWWFTQWDYRFRVSKDEMEMPEPFEKTPDSVPELERHARGVFTRWQPNDRPPPDYNLVFDFSFRTDRSASPK